LGNHCAGARIGPIPAFSPRLAKRSKIAAAMPTPAHNEPRLVSYEGRRISVRTQSVENGLFVVAALGVWTDVQGRTGYIKLTAPSGEFASRQEAHDAAVASGQRAVDQGRA